MNASNLMRKAGKAIQLLAMKQGRRGLLKGVALTNEHIEAMSGLNLCSVVDIGANKGQFALLIRQLYPSSKIYSFEPLSEPASKFRSLFDRDPNVQLFEMAVGPFCGNAEIHISRQMDSSSLLPIGSKQSELFPGTDEIGTRSIEVTNLSGKLTPEDLATPSLLKIDVQGYELEVLKGCEDLLGSFNYCYVECSNLELYKGQALTDEVIGFLRKHEYEMRSKLSLSVADKMETANAQVDILFESRNEAVA